jgi:4-amino-4-deoxy-L-arabinose transferase-like glycosyltransferase
VPDALRRWGSRAFPPLPPLDRRARRALLAIVVMAAVLRIVWALQAQAPHELRDPVLYLILGDQLAHGHGYSYGPGPDQGVTAYYPPGYPFFLAGVIWLAGLLPGVVTAFGVAIVANVALSVLLVWLVFALGRRVAGTAVGLVAVAVTALWPNLVFHSGIVLTETLFLVVFVALLLVALASPEVARRPGWARVATVGVLFGFTALIRPVSLVIAPLFLVLWWGDGARRALQRTGLALLAAVLVILPWSIRSTVRMESPVLLSLNLGDNLCIGNNPEATGGYALPDYCFHGLETGKRPRYETHRQSETIDRAVRFMRDNPGKVLGLVPDRARLTLRDDHDGLVVAADWGTRPLFSSSRTDALANLADAFYYGVAALSVAGLAVLVARRRRLAGRGRGWLFLVLTAPAQLVSPLVTFGEPRFKMPMYPVFALTAAVALVAAVRRGRWPEPPPSGGRLGAGEDRGVATGATTDATLADTVA